MHGTNSVRLTKNTINPCVTLYLEREVKREVDDLTVDLHSGFTCLCMSSVICVEQQ